MGLSSDDAYWKAFAEQEKADKEAQERHKLRTEQRKTFMAKLLPSSDVLDWVAPDKQGGSDEVLAEHLAQLRTVVRYALQFALADDLGLKTNLSAANTAQRMIQTNIALAKVLQASESSDSKTVRGGRAKKAPQD